MKPNASTLVATIVVATVVSIAAAWVFSPGSNSAGTLPAVQQYLKIRDSGTIRAAYAVGAPLFTIDPNSGQKSGIFYEALTMAAQRLGLKVEWTTEIGYGEMIQGLRDDRYDLVGSGVWINADRAKSADFSNPLYFDAIYAYGRNSDITRLSGLTTLNSPDVTISTMDGELGAAIAEVSFPKAKTLALPQNATFTQLILNVIDRKADLVFLARGPAADYDAVHPGEIGAIDSTKPLRIFPNAVMLAKGQYLLKDSLNYVLAEMQNDGSIDGILKKYEKTPDAFLRVAPPYQASVGQ